MNDVCMSTMMAEYYALSYAMREVLPVRDLVKALAPRFGFESRLSTQFKSVVHEDNTGCLTLAHLEPGRDTPRSKFYDSKIHWFRQHLHPDDDSSETDGPITVVKIDTKQQIADIFTKPLPRPDFERLRDLLMGW